MPGEMLNTKEVAEYLGINEKQVYALIKAEKIPCTRATGKWIFPKNLIDEWINSEAKSVGRAKEKSRNVRGAILAAGSNDPNLDILLNLMKQKYPEFYFFTSSIGSTEGLRLLKQGYTDVAFCHLFDPQTGDYNIPFISDFFTDKKIAIVHLFYRELGFITSSDDIKVKSFKDLEKEDVNFINRQTGSGTRIYIDYCLEKEKVDIKKIKGYDREVISHLEVGLSMQSGKANAGICTIAIAKLLGLPFTPLVKESFDMVLSQEVFFDKGIQAFIDVLNSEEVREKISTFGNYDFNNAGKIIYSST